METTSRQTHVVANGFLRFNQKAVDMVVAQLQDDVKNTAPQYETSQQMQYGHSF